MRICNAQLKPLVALFFSAFTIVSCEKETYVTYFVKNEASERIYLNFESLVHGNAMKDTIDVNETKVIVGWKHFGKDTGVIDPASMFGDNFNAIIESGTELKSEVLSANRWSAKIENHRAVADHNYTLTLSDSDFE